MMAFLQLSYLNKPVYCESLFTPYNSFIASRRIFHWHVELSFYFMQKYTAAIHISRVTALGDIFHFIDRTALETHAMRTVAVAQAQLERKQNAPA